jgi:hypothetical protein
MKVIKMEKKLTDYYMLWTCPTIIDEFSLMQAEDGEGMLSQVYRDAETELSVTVFNTLKEYGYVNIVEMPKTNAMQLNREMQVELCMVPVNEMFELLTELKELKETVRSMNGDD